MLVQVKYYGPTNHRGARWKVWVEGFKVSWYPRDYEKEPAEDAEARAREYAASLGADPETVRRIGQVCDGYDFAVSWPERGPWLRQEVRP